MRLTEYRSQPAYPGPDPHPGRTAVWEEDQPEEEEKAQNLLITVARALAKGKLHVGTLTGLERFLLAQMALPDRVPMLLAATNVEPQLIDSRFNYQILAESTEANLELFARVKERFAFDVITSPTWLGLMVTGVAELGVQFQIDKRPGVLPGRPPHPAASG